MRRTYECFFLPGEVTEIRAIDVKGSGPWGSTRGKGTVSGYFNNPDDFGRAAEALDKAGAKGVYFTINPVNPALLARAANRLIAAPANTTQDNDIRCIRWLPIDLDPIRPAGISSTDQEMQAAIDLAKKITTELEKEMGFARAVRGFSGNGVHICYRLPDLPNDEIHRNLIRNAIASVAFVFTNDRVDVDQKTFNPSRIWKLYGTTGRKGDSTPDRPHRKSYLYENQPLSLDGKAEGTQQARQDEDDVPDSITTGS